MLKLRRTNYHLLIVNLILLTGIFLSGCKAYRQNLIFKTEKEGNYMNPSFQKAIEDAKENYVIQRDDYIKFRVFTNDGEKIVDPNNELNQQNTNRQQQGDERDRKYLVRSDGKVGLPMVGDVTLAGLTLDQADSVLAEKFSKFYKDVFVTTEFTNKRVIVLGAVGGQVIPLENQNMNILEVIALAGGLPQDSKAYNIRLIRGDLKNPQVNIIDLSTLQGMQNASLRVEPNDVIYVEPVRRVWNESIRDISPVLGIISNVITLMFLFRRF